MLFAVRGDAGDVDAVEGGRDAVLRGLAGVVGDLGGVQQGLGRDAADVQAGAAELVLLDQADGEAQLDGAQRRGVAAASATEDDKVKVLLGQPGNSLAHRICDTDCHAVVIGGQAEWASDSRPYDLTTAAEKSSASATGCARPRRSDPCR